MQIKITQCPDREEATVEVVDPGGDGTPESIASCTELCNGESVTLTVPMAGSATDIEVGEVEAKSPIQPVGEGDEFEEAS